MEKAAKAVLNALEYPDVELSLLITDDSEIEIFNRDYLNRQGPTNVISFPMHEGEFAGMTPHMLGDVVISMDTAQKEAEKMNIRLEERFNELLIHGILHLFGYDHEKSEEETVRMEDKTFELMKYLNI
ncbi:rRNA maturation RNase YbeY [Desulfobacterales bacterium HSG17]|nr:rRNA maturation RNase YbeY [Desulfobacterales bacterium HSG17]